MDQIVLILFVLKFVSSQEDPLVESTTIPDPVNLFQYPGDDCFRTCTGIQSDRKICYWQFHLEFYAAMGPACGNCANGQSMDCFNGQCITADGLERGVLSINRKLAGPQIHVCRGDQIIVDMINNMAGLSTSLHWHGFHMRATPWMDGVPYLTQCPVPYASTFRYSYRATESGTLWYHSHSGLQKANGIYGGLVVRDAPSRDFNFHEYDLDLKEHLIVISEWMTDLAEMFWPGLPTRGNGISPSNILINGLGTVRNLTSRKSITKTPLAVFRVRKGLKHRFRLVNAGSHVCQMMIEIEGHDLKVIATDSFEVRPETMDAIYSTSGERYDFVVIASKPINGQDNYWIRVRSIGNCATNGNEIEQYAILSYAPSSVSDAELSFPARDFPAYSNTFNRKFQLGHPYAVCNIEGDDDFCVSDLEAFVQAPYIVSAIPDQTFYLGFQNPLLNNAEVFKNNSYYSNYMNIRNNMIAGAAINGITFHSTAFPLLTQPELITPATFCDVDNIPDFCAGSLLNCPCTHIIKINLNSIVELVLVDESVRVGLVTHPFHLHGYQFYVMQLGESPTGDPMTVRMAESLTATKSLRKAGYSLPPLKDTIAIPSKGFAIVRFKADNPGFWYMHCHIAWHLSTGMALVVQVGEIEDMVPAPNDFPKCGDFMPDYY